MVHLWGSKAREETEMSKSALGDCTPGDIAVVVAGEKLDNNLVYLGCQMAKGARRKVHLVHVIEVPRALPLKAELTQEAEQADKLLNAAMDIAHRVGCEAIPEIVQARESGSAIVDEVRDHQCALLLVGLIRRSQEDLESPDRTVSYILANAPCRVWLVQDPPGVQQPAQSVHA
jgi:nucleotide-binding universal stress UspA family protein